MNRRQLLAAGVSLLSGAGELAAGPRRRRACVPFSSQEDQRYNGACARPYVDSMTVLVHGTWSRGLERGPILDFYWYRPGSRFQRYVREHGIFTDVYRQSDYFRWSGCADYSARQQAAEELKAWCDARPAGFRRLVGHSHGANVINLALGLGLVVDEVLLCSPPVPPPGHACLSCYLPTVGNIRRGCFQVLYSETDGVIKSIEDHDWRREYSGTPVESDQAAKMLCDPSNHWSTVDRDVWERDGVPAFLAAGCPQPLETCG